MAAIITVAVNIINISIIPGGYMVWYHKLLL